MFVVGAGRTGHFVALDDVHQDLSSKAAQQHEQRLIRLIEVRPVHFIEQFYDAEDAPMPNNWNSNDRVGRELHTTVDLRIETIVRGRIVDNHRLVVAGNPLRNTLARGYAKPDNIVLWDLSHSNHED